MAHFESDLSDFRPAKKLKREHASRLEPVLTRLSFKLAPILPLPEGEAHPSFPATILHYVLLTEAQLDSMAVYYHQDVQSPCIWTNGYPSCMNWDNGFLEHIGITRGSEARLWIKRRKFGRFIGFAGCETPTEEIEEKMRWQDSKGRVQIKSPSEFAFRRGFRQW